MMPPPLVAAAALDRRSVLLAGLASSVPWPAWAGRPTVPLPATRLARTGEALARDEDFSGVLLLADAGGTRLHRAWGLRQRGEALPNRPDTRFNIASMGKMFTAIATLRLAEAGRLDLDAPVAKAWPDCPARSLAVTITPAQLLSHTAGLGNALWAMPPRQWLAVRRQRDLFALISAAPPERPPGGDFLYSNDGYVLLGAVIETLTGAPLHEHLASSLFAPLGMAATSLTGPDDLSANLALPYVRDLERPGQWQTALASAAVPATAAGGATSTAPDLLRFAQAMADGTLIGPQMMQAWTTPRQPFRDGHYGYGLEMRHINGQRLIGHSGGHDGVAAELMLWPDDGRIAIILHNGEVDGYWPMAHGVRQAFCGDHPAAADFTFTRHVAHMIATQGEAAGRELFAASPGRQLRASLIEALGNRAWHRGQGRAALALLHFNRATAPDDAGPAWALAELLRRMGDREAARTAYRDYLALAPGDADALAALSRLG
jgi:D-alanyl-D-alanine carboxypeptidase